MTEDINSDKTEKILEKPLMGGIAVPVAIVLVGALIIFGVTRMLSVGKTYRDLVSELHSKTFGNRWVAAYELSKVIASKQVPEKDLPWLVENLSTVYKNSIDARTRNFIILAIGSIGTKDCLETLKLAINDKDAQVKFNAIVSIGNFDSSMLEGFDWSVITKLLESTDAGIRQVSSYALANHKVEKAALSIRFLLADSDITVKHAAAISLIAFKSEAAIKNLKEILELDSKVNTFYDASQIETLKISLINALIKEKWNILTDEIEKLTVNAGNTKLSVKAAEALNILKN